jgi:hypothetical protein
VGTAMKRVRLLFGEERLAKNLPQTCFASNFGHISQTAPDHKEHPTILI